MPLEYAISIDELCVVFHHGWKITMESKQFMSHDLPSDVGVFQNRLKEGHFNEPLAHKPTLSLVQMVTRVECYIKNEVINDEKKVHDEKECVFSIEDSHH